MKEITRIHIAKTAYDIELAAKKAIEKYITALERYADDPELLGDIEIRITELLKERGVQAGGVITADDVAAVRAQLGEPSEFLPEGAGDIAVGTESTDEPGRRVYRDLDSAVLGGVLAGFGRFFGIDPLWVRLIFIVLLLASFGAAIIVYLILWLIIPPARTAAEKLRMNGEPVTLESIKRLGEQPEARSAQTAKILQTVLRYGVGVVVALMAAASFIITTIIGFGLLFGSADNTPLASLRVAESGWVTAAFSMFIVGGLLFAALCTVLAIAIFRRQWSRRTTAAVIAIVAAGLIVVVAGVGTSMYGYTWERERVYEQRKTTKTNLPAQYSGIKSLTIAGDNSATYAGRIEYIVASKPSYQLEALPGIKPQFTIAEDGLSAEVKLAPGQYGARYGWYYDTAPVLKIYGPALEQIRVVDDAVAVQYTNQESQANLGIDLQGSSQIELNGTYETVNVNGADGSVAELSQAIITNLLVNGGAAQAGVVSTLNVSQPQACAAFQQDSSQHRVSVQAVSSGKLIYNGTELPAKTINNICGKVLIGYDKDEYNEKEQD